MNGRILALRRSLAAERASQTPTAGAGPATPGAPLLPQGSAAAMARPRPSAPGTTWQLRWLAVCASTETELERWLQRQPPPQTLEQPRAVLARHQSFGHGQHGRAWLSPPGGVWLSAALPWPSDPLQAAAPGLAVAVALAEVLRRRELTLQLKWPNDLLLCTPAGPRKLAGLLPGLRLRGSRVRWARIGLGLNGRNPVPPGAANLRRQARIWNGEPAALSALALLALEEAMALAGQAEVVRRRAEALLGPLPPRELEGEWWQPQGLSRDGGLELVHADGRRRTLRRF